MVERSADVVTLDRKPVKQSAFLRADAAIRRMPGLGILIVLFLAFDMYHQGSWFGFMAIAVGTLAMLADEFLRPSA